MELPKDKFTLFFLIIFVLLFIWLILFLLMKLVNINSVKCYEDSDCIRIDDSCFSSCYKNKVINKNYEKLKNVETVIKCIPTIPLNILFFNHVMLDCMPNRYPTKPICNEKNRCEVVVDCGMSCYFIDQHLDYFYNHYYYYRLFELVSNLKQNNCECDINFCSKIVDVCKDLVPGQDQERVYCSRTLEKLNCDPIEYNDY